MLLIRRAYFDGGWNGRVPPGQDRSVSSIEALPSSLNCHQRVANAVSSKPREFPENAPTSFPVVAVDCRNGKRTRPKRRPAMARSWAYVSGSQVLESRFKNPALGGQHGSVYEEWNKERHDAFVILRSLVW